MDSSENSIEKKINMELIKSESKEIDNSINFFVVEEINHNEIP